MQSKCDDLLLNTFESYTELYFNNKCRELLKFIGKDNLCKYAKNNDLFERIFTSDILSPEGINHALLKKYCLSSHKNNEVTKTLDILIHDGYFKEANDMLNMHTTARSVLLEIYIENINVSNAKLMAEKSIKQDYQIINETLQGIDDFYKGKHQNQPVVISLKKVYK